MRILLVFSFFIIGFLSLFLSDSWAACDLSNGNMVDFLKGCAGSTENAVSNQGDMGIQGVQKLIQDVAKQAIGFGALFAIGAIVFAGIRYTTSYGDDEKVKHAKTTATYALIGLLLLGLAFSGVDTIVYFIVEVIGK